MSKLADWKEYPRFWFGLVFGVALAERIALALVYPVRVYNDTNAYRRLAEAILKGWKNYDGTRTPGYPALLAAAGSNEQVYLVQLGMGLIITLLFFWIGWQASGKPAFGALAAFAHTFNPGQIFFEANLMTETAATFWIVLSVAGVFAWMRYPRYRKLPLALGIGAAAALAGLTRPLYVPLAFWIALYLGITPALEKGIRLKERLRLVSLRAILGVSIPAVALTGAWVVFLHDQYNMWNITALTGYNFIQHTGYYFEYVPDEYAGLRDTYIKYRDERIAKYGTQGNAIWDAIPEMERVSGLSFYDLSRTLARLSIQLIREHPDLYLKYAASGWWLYWRAPVYWSADNLAIPALAPVLKVMILGARGLIFGANMVFLVSSLAALLWAKLRKAWNVTPFLTFLAWSIWAISILQTLPDHGDNPRFLIPMQSLLVFWVLWLAFSMWQKKSPASVYN